MQVIKCKKQARVVRGEDTTGRQITNLEKYDFEGGYTTRGLRIRQK